MFQYEENEAKKGRPSWYFLQGFTDMLTAHPAVREGYARYQMYTGLPVYINPQDLLVGNLNWATSSELIFHNVGNQMICEEKLAEFLEDESISNSEKEVVTEKIEKMRPYTLNDIDAELSEEQALVSKSTAGGSTHYNGHMVLDYETLLEEGLSGYLEKINKLQKEKTAGGDYEFYRGMQYTLLGMQEFIRRHAQLAEALLLRNAEGYDRERLRLIKEVCVKVAGEAPETFLEALQLVWFVFCFGDYDSYGRFDQYLAPFYEKEMGQRGEQSVKELLGYFFRKGEENRGILNMTIGGKRADGKSQVTPFTLLIMDVVRELSFKSPNLCLRIDADSSQELYEKVHQNLSTGQAIPALYHDDVIIPMLLKIGIPSEDAYGYCLAGCSQIIIPGKSNFCCDVGIYNALKVLEITLHCGVDPLQGAAALVRQPPLHDIKDFEQLYDRYLEQMRFCVRQGVDINHIDILKRKNMPSMVRSMFTRGCLERARGIFDGGPQYFAVQNEIIGLTNVADALTAVYHLVYAEARYTLEELVAMADRNFEGYEAVHRQLLQAPKFGNDHGGADAMRCRVGEDFYKELRKYETPYGGVHWPGEVIFQSHMTLAPFTKASLDGRLDYEPLADSAGPMRGMDREGPTGVINSMCKIPFTAPTVCRTLNLRFSKELFGKQKEQMIHLLRTFFLLRGCQLQINVTDKEELQKAQKEKTGYENLVVRIGGYNDYFVELPKEMQDEVMERTQW